MRLQKSWGLTVARAFALFGALVPRSRGGSVHGRSLKQFFVVSSCLVALMAAASLVAVEGHLRSQSRYQGALAARADVARVQRAAILFWREREAVNEYLLLPSPSLIAEVEAQERAFDRTLNETDPNPLHEEVALSTSARAANDAFVTSFKRDESMKGGATHRAIVELDKQGAMVVGPVEALVRVNLASVRKSERQATAAARNALVGALAGGLIVLALLGIFIAYVLRLIRDLRRQAEQSEHAALHDSLTDLPNRTLLYDRVEHEIRRCTRDPAPFSMLMVDLDRFKEINDTLGHSMGDLLLKQLGPRVTGSLRPGDTLARISGDEFAVLLPGATGEGATEIATRILATLRQPFRLPIMNPRLSASIGIVTYPTHGDNAEALIQHADVALHQAKEHRNASAIYDYTRDPYNPARLELASDLDRAVANDEFELHYQPILETHTLELTAVEALLRWQHPERGLLNPSEFIALAEHTGLIRQLTLLLLRKAIRQAREWQEQGEPRPVAVNLSAASLLDTDLALDVTSILESEGVNAAQLGLEITETTIMTDPEQALTTLRELHALGICISIDDFGTGYSSLAYLRHLPVSEIKIDKSFVQQLARDDANAKIVESTIELAHSLGFSVVAEGVEDQQALELLAAYGCDKVQGFHLCRPQPAADLNRALQRTTQQTSRTRGLRLINA